MTVPNETAAPVDAAPVLAWPARTLLLDPDGTDRIGLFVDLPDRALATDAAAVPGAAWDAGARRWRFPLHPAVLPGLRGLLRTHRLEVTAKAAAALREVAERVGRDPGAGTIAEVDVADDGRVLVRFDHPTPALAEAFKRVPSLRWDGSAHAFTAPSTRLREVLLVAEAHPELVRLSTAAHTAAGAADTPLDYDGTLRGLQGVPVTELAGVGAARSEKFAELGVRSVFDLLMLLPRKLLDRSRLTPIKALRAGDEAALLATVTTITADQRRRLVKVGLADGSGKITVTYFNAAWQARRFRVGDTVAVWGKVDAWTSGSGRTVLSLTNPIMDPVGADTRPVIPVYPQSAKARVTTWELASAVSEALRRLGPLADPLPEELTTVHGLMPRLAALRAVHAPVSLEQADAGRTRLAFDELFAMQVALLLAKAADSDAVGVAHTPTGELTSQVLAGLPYTLTGAQTRALSEVDADLRAPHPMHRLLQGEVGSGKTQIAAMTLLKGVEGGYQGALMAPTEILASQLFRELVERTAGLTGADGSPLRVEFFSNKLRGRKRTEVLAALADGSIDIAVGTHALLVEDVVFANLGVVVVDEQHRFGVEQRSALAAKGPLLDPSVPDGPRVRPDVLVMTATPIPRTATITLLGDLEVSVLDELPPGRTPIATEWLDEEVELDDPADPVWAAVRGEVAAGRQAYVVCPLVEDSEKLQAASAVETHAALAAGALAGLRVGLVHGQQNGEERTATMTAFVAGELDVLVATTVIEVGVNVPNASVIVVLDPARFGIAQLHQLRGRVGRGVHASRCLLVGRCTSSDARTRMQALEESTDGFYLSEVDLRLRGYGQVFGAAQSGESDLRIADLDADRELLEAARAAAAELLAGDPVLARRPALRGEVAAVLPERAAAWLAKS